MSDPEKMPVLPAMAYAKGFADGTARTAAALVGAAAARLGTEHPLINRMVEIVGALTPHDDDDEREP